MWSKFDVLRFNDTNYIGNNVCFCLKPYMCVNNNLRWQESFCGKLMLNKNTLGVKKVRGQEEAAL